MPNKEPENFPHTALETISLSSLISSDAHCRAWQAGGCRAPAAILFISDNAFSHSFVYILFLRSYRKVSHDILQVGVSHNDAGVNNTVGGHPNGYENKLVPK